jgi:hypothetical protein
LHGPHHGAQKSTMTMSFPLMISSKLSFVKATVAMRQSPDFLEREV